VPKTFLVEWCLCVACYFPTTPTDYPSTTRGTSVGPPVAVNIDFCGYLRIWILGLSELYGYGTPLTTFLVKTEFSHHRPVLIFQPTVKSRASNKPSSGRNMLVSWDKIRSYHMLTYKLWFVEGVHSGSTQKPWPWGTCSLPCHCSVTDRSEQNSSKLWHTVCNVFIIHLAI
jgi:hypothetical protein